MLHVIETNHTGHSSINYLDGVKEKDLIEWN